MYCPRCSNEQGLEEMRFCSRCGFPLAGVALLLDNSGTIPMDSAQQPQRNKMMKESVLLTLLAWAIGLASTLLWDVGVPLESFAKIGALVFFILGLVGLIRFVIAFLHVDTIQPSLPRASYSRTMAENPTRAALPAAQSIPASDYAPSSNTKEIVSRPSVTENTTRLLNDPDN